MKKLNVFLWYLPLCFLIFLATFILVKFILIFFFNAAFQPDFMFDLTPYYILSGANNLHLILLSLIVVGLNAYLHFNISKKNLALSFLPTGLMLASLGFKIAIREMEISNISHYLIFGLLLIVVLVDHRHFLTFPEITMLSEKKEIDKRKPFEAKVQYTNFAKSDYEKLPISDKTFNLSNINEILTINKESIENFGSLLKDDIKRSNLLLEELEHRTAGIEEEIRNLRYKSSSYNMDFECPYKSFFDNNKYNDKINQSDYSDGESKNEKQIRLDDLYIDKLVGCAIVIKRGILIKVNKSFEDLLGFDKDILFEKTLFNFVAPEGLFNIQEYYFNRLKGIRNISYNTVLLNNNSEKIQVEITMKPIKYFGEMSDLAIVRKLKRFDS